MLRAVSFDFWNTIFIDDSNDYLRRSKGLKFKRNERIDILYGIFNKYKPIARGKISKALKIADAYFEKIWKEKQKTPSVSDRLKIASNEISIKLSESDFNTAVLDIENQLLKAPPRIISGVKASIQQLSEKYKLVIISDTIYAPGRVLRKLLEDQNILSLFQVLIFSDEVGYSKPSPEIFQEAKVKLGLSYNEIVHIGDLEENDIIGAKNVGMYAGLFNKNKTKKIETVADFVFDTYCELSTIIDTIKK